MKSILNRYPAFILVMVAIGMVIIFWLTSCAGSKGIIYSKQPDGIYVSKKYWCDSSKTYIIVPLYKYSLTK